MVNDNCENAKVQLDDDSAAAATAHEGNENDVTVLKAKNISSRELLKNIPWPFEASELYKIAVRFYKDNVDKAFHPSYEQKNSLVAYTFQERYGKFNAERASPLGALDFVGHDRRKAWILLEDMTPSVAQKNFIDLLDCVCPLFRPYVMAIKCDLDEKRRKLQEAEEMEKQKQKQLEECEQRKLEEEALRKEEERIKKYEEQKRLIKDILNRQTLNQFTSYAKQQYPDSVELQEHLVAQLQEQHFQQYMQQMMEHSQDAFQLNGDALHNGSNIGADLSQASFDSTLSEAVSNQLSLNDSSLDNVDVSNGHKIEEEEVSDEEEEEDENGMKEIANASMWTRKDIVTFKESIMAEGKDGVLKVGHGEIATIRVPTHHEGNCIFWEFATDHYDIGFGLMFEWTSNPDNQVSIHISESDEDEEEEEDFPAANHSGENDIESGQVNGSKTMKEKGSESSVSIIIPIYRRDCHEEVFAGNHVYPGKGVYHLKFDNSYSLWRSKILYYRVYYTKEA